MHAPFDGPFGISVAGLRRFGLRDIPHIVDPAHDALNALTVPRPALDEVEREHQVGAHGIGAVL